MIEHNILEDPLEVLGLGSFDLVCLRLTLFWLHHAAWRDGDWWTVRGYDKAFGRKLPALFERCGLKDIRHEARTEVIRGASQWARWWTLTLSVINELGGGAAVESYRRELNAMTTALADPTVFLLRELLHACLGRRVGNAG